MILAPFDRGQATKTNTFDEALSLDDVRAPWLGAALLRFVALRRREERQKGVPAKDLGRQRLWRQSRPQFLTAFRRQAERLQVLWLAETLYVLRHGGASRDVGTKARGMLDILRRGRWAHGDSVKHYERHGRLQWILNQVPRETVRAGMTARATFAAQLRSIW